MLYLIVKTLISAVTIVAVSELSRRSSIAGALLASLPLTSLLAFAWLYRDTHDVERIAALSTGIFWLVLPSLVLFLALPALLRRGCTFVPALGLSTLAMFAAYGAMAAVLRAFHIRP
jgi:F0F1-type ATP synthase assembly protein I